MKVSLSKTFKNEKQLKVKENIFQTYFHCEQKVCETLSSAYKVLQFNIDFVLIILGMTWKK